MADQIRSEGDVERALLCPAHIYPLRWYEHEVVPLDLEESEKIETVFDYEERRDG